MTTLVKNFLKNHKPDTDSINDILEMTLLSAVFIICVLAIAPIT
jgi:hypothetical protein